MKDHSVSESAGWGFVKSGTAPRSPWQNPYVERLVGSIRREYLDHVMVFNKCSLRGLLNSYFAYYLEARTHLALSRTRPNRARFNRRNLVPWSSSPKSEGSITATSGERLEQTFSSDDSDFPFMGLDPWCTGKAGGAMLRSLDGHTQTLRHDKSSIRRLPDRMHRVPLPELFLEQSSFWHRQGVSGCCFQDSCTTSCGIMPCAPSRKRSSRRHGHNRNNRGSRASQALAPHQRVICRP